MNRIKLLIILIFISCNLWAQNNFQQITAGGGGGIAEAYAGAQVQKITSAGFADAGYYPDPFFNVNIEWQAGALSGASLNHKDYKSFNNNYHAVIINAEIQSGEIFNYQNSDFLNAVKNIYVGTGYGILINSINNVNIHDLAITDHVNNTIRVVPFKLGYECNLINGDEAPLIKIDFLYSFNYTIEKGLDGYNTINEKGSDFYNYFAIGLKYTASLRKRRVRPYNRFD